MGTNPTKAAGNIYCQCRKAAARYNDKLNSREGAAEQLGYSSSTLAGWELGTDRPSPEAVLLMVDLYHAPELKNYYCRKECYLGCDVPKLELEDLDRITIKAISTFRKITETREILLDITEDGKISENERPEFEIVMTTLNEISSIAQSLKVWAEKNLR